MRITRPPVRFLVFVITVLIVGEAIALRAARSAPSVTPFDASYLGSLKFRSIGPAITGGRTVEFAVVENNPDIVYAATASGGAWKTVNGGVTWDPVFERERTVSIGAIAVSPANPNLVWIGTGEANSVRSSSWGDGVYKSADGGKTWINVGLEKSRHVGRVLLHPANPDVAYVAAMGSLWGPNEERGLYKTTDGGRTWTKVLNISQYTGVVDAAMDPRDPEVLYAAAFQRERRYYSFVGGGPEGGLFKTTNGGKDWSKLSNGLPTGPVGRIGIAVCRSQPDSLYAAVVGPGGGIFRSDDRGASWERRNREVTTHWYYGQIACDPKNPDRIYLPLTRFHISDDGGRTFRTDFATPGVHGDYHTIWINPSKTDHMLLGSDGGVYQSRDRGRSWEFMDTLSIAQFYTVGVDMREPFYYVYGGTQDNSSYGGPSSTRNSDGIVNDDWFMTVGGDGFYAQVDPTDPTTVYSESQYGNLFRFDTRTGERHDVQPQPPVGQKYRWNWSAPILISAHDSKTVYFAANILFKSPDRGDSWQIISRDLTRQIDESTLPLQGKVQPKDAIDLHASTADYGNVTTIAESPLRRGILAVGTDDGLVQVTRDDGATWTKMDRFPGVPERPRVSRVVLSRFAEQTIYATFDAHQDNDFKPYVVKSADFGKTWRSIASDFPDYGPVHVITEHPARSGVLLAGTEFGLFVSIDDGGHWTALKNNLPTVAVHDIVVHPREHDVILATHGRGFWILDDTSFLGELTPETLAGTPKLFPIKPAIEFHRFARGRNSTGQQKFVGENRQDGALITYAAAAGQNVQIEVVDSAGTLIRRLTVPRETSGGIQRVAWDLRHTAPFTEGEQRGGGFGGALRGPFVLPGDYRVRLKVGNQEQYQTVQVKGDPLVNITEADRKTWHDTLISLGRLFETSRAAQVTLDQLQARLNAIRAVLAPEQATPSGVAARIRAFGDELKAVRTELETPPEEGVARTPGPPGLADQIRQTYVGMEASTAPPNADQRRIAGESVKRLTAVVDRLNTLAGASLTALHAELDKAGVRWTQGRTLTLPPLAMPRER